MISPRSTPSDERMDQIVSAILRTGVGLAALVVLAGGVYYLVKHGGQPPHYAQFHGQPPQLRTLPGILVFAFALQRDRTYVVVTLIVLGVLLYNLIGGYR